MYMLCATSGHKSWALAPVAPVASAIQLRMINGRRWRLLAPLALVALTDMGIGGTSTFGTGGACGTRDL